MDSGRSLEKRHEGIRIDKLWLARSPCSSRSSLTVRGLTTIDRRKHFIALRASRRKEGWDYIPFLLGTGGMRTTDEQARSQTRQAEKAGIGTELDARDPSLTKTRRREEHCRAPSSCCYQCSKQSLPAVNVPTRPDPRLLGSPLSRLCINNKQEQQQRLQRILDASQTHRIRMASRRSRGSDFCLQYTGPTRRGAGVSFPVIFWSCLANSTGLVPESIPRTVGLLRRHG
ncbi:hypothetical protein LZ31DRAFT_356305 [Colletotrichum somersetense]|nr:hypothetical protein LZ31DRAFT_356305 [Colletotrichum somersetense]